MKNIGELSVLFQRLGGQFDNVEIKHSENAGYYCCTLDSNKNSIISCPAGLLVDINDLDINEDGLYIKHPEKYGDKIEFLNEYFAFHFNAAAVRQQTVRKQQIDSLSNEDLSVISNIFPPDFYNLKEYSGLEYEKKQIINCHNIKHFEKKVIMPFVSFVNYNKNGQSFKVGKDKISISGKFNDEIYAKYNDDDVLRIATGYDFITDTKYIYSIPLTYKMLNGKKMIINRDPLEAIDLGNGRWKPLITKKQDSITLSWFPLHMDGAPIYPAIIAKMIADEINIPAENILFNVIKLNLHALIPAAFQLRESENLFARYLGSVAQRQLETIAGTRQ